MRPSARLNEELWKSDGGRRSASFDDREEGAGRGVDALFWLTSLIVTLVATALLG